MAKDNSDAESEYRSSEEMVKTEDDIDFIINRKKEQTPHYETMFESSESSFGMIHTFYDRRLK